MSFLSILNGIGSVIGHMASYILYFTIGIAVFKIMQLIPGPPVNMFDTWAPVFAYTMKLNFILPVSEVMNTIILTSQLLLGFLSLRAILFVASFFIPQITGLYTFGRFNANMNAQDSYSSKLGKGSMSSEQAISQNIMGR